MSFKLRDAADSEWTPGKRKTTRKERKTTFAHQQGLTTSRKGSRAFQFDSNDIEGERSNFQSGGHRFNRPSIPTHRDSIMNARNSIIPTLSNRVTDKMGHNGNYAWID